MDPKRKSRHVRITSINSSVVRNINRSIILDAIRVHQPISRSKISLLTRLNKSTVSSIVDTLIADELIAEDIDRNKKIGRNPINLRVKKGIHIVGAISIDPRSTIVAVVDIDGTVKASVTLRTEANAPEAFIIRCLEELTALWKKFPSHYFNGIGITVPGIVDSLHSTVVFAPRLGWEHVDIGRIVLGHDPSIDAVAVENDARACAVAELVFGTQSINPANYIFLSVGAGIGAGIVVDNRLLSGHSHAAGEFGHMIIVENGEQCSCGNLGCWEMYASDRATVRRYRALKNIQPGVKANLCLADVVAAAGRGEPEAVEAVKRAAYYLGLGISNIIRAFDPEFIVIGGRITQCWDILAPGISETLSTCGFLGTRTSAVIVPTSLADNPPLLGAAALSIRKIFTDYKFAL